MTSTHTDVVDIHLLQLPLDLLSQSQQHSDEITREFSHITSPQTDTDRVPDRLLALSSSIRGRYAGFTGPVLEQIEQAKDRGETAIDVTFTMPPDVGDAVKSLGAMWEEVDEFCRNGDLLTLATPPELAEFRRWFLGQFTAQLDGEPPVAWPDRNG